jgi:hypothetical protein
MGPKKNMLKQITRYAKEVSRQAKAIEIDKVPKSVITYYNY